MRKNRSVQPGQVSLIITTYNWKEALQLSLQSALAQMTQPLEIIVADDGSRQDTAVMVREMATRSAIPIIHSWQQDRGFRLARSRNRAIAQARGEYIVLIDGDILLEEHFIADHLRFARPGFFVQGGRALLKARLSQQVLTQKKLPPKFCGMWVENRKNCLRSSLLAHLFSFKSSRLRGIKTCNFAFWKSDAMAINGFNESFEGWGREDSEFTARLMHRGVKRLNLRFHALAYHLHHPPRGRERLRMNDQILHQTMAERKCWCDKGLLEHL